MSLNSFRSAQLALGLFILVIVAIPCACLYGQFDISIVEAMAGLSQYLTSTVMQNERCAAIVDILIQIRLPRAIAAVLCGGSLAMAEAILQGSLRNPLADPFTLGISAGAACSASLSIAFAAHMPIGIDQNIFISSAAILGAIFSLFVTIILGKGTGSLSRESVILAGIAVASFLGAMFQVLELLNLEHWANKQVDCLSAGKWPRWPGQ